MYRARGTLDDGQAFGFTVEGNNFVAANQNALATLDREIGMATGRVVSFKLSLLEPQSGEFKLRKPDKRSRRANAETPLPFAPVATGTAPIPTASTPLRPTAKK